MTREEQIDKAAWEYAQSRSNDRGIAYLTFKDIAEWADRTMLARCCEWLDNINTDNYMDSGIFQMYDLIKDLRKEMEK